MAIVRPFRAVRPAKEYADKVVSLPYDVMNREEATKMAEGNQYSFLHICRSEIDLPFEDNPYSDSVYNRAKSNIEGFLVDEIFVRDEKPMLYIYKQVMNGRAQTGVVGCVAIDDYLNNVIKKHEFTREEKEQDRIKHFDVCNANTEPVFMTYREDKRLKTLIEGWINGHSPEYDFITNDGISHTFWMITDDGVINSLTALFGEVESLYIADGHHRSASAVKVGIKRREEKKSYTDNEDYNYFMAVIFPDHDLRIFDYNRVIKDLNGLTNETFMDKLAEKFEIKSIENGPYSPETKHTFGMFIDGKWYKLKAKTQIICKDDLIKSLGVSILQDNLLAPILGIEDPRTDKRIDFIGGIRGLEELEKRVGQDMTVAFALHPVSIEEILEVSDKGLVMPPKSTWFEPKLGSGLFIHEL